MKLEAGAVYKLKFKADTEKNSELTIKVGADGERGYYGYWQKNIKITPNQKEYVFDLEMLAKEDKSKI